MLSWSPSACEKGLPVPQLIRLYIVNVALGFVLALIFTALLIGLDVGHLRHLVGASGAVGALAVLMLVVFNTILFAGVQFAIAVMRLARSEPPPRGGRRIGATGQPQPAPAVSAAASRNR